MLFITVWGCPSHLSFAVDKNLRQTKYNILLSFLLLDCLAWMQIFRIVFTSLRCVHGSFLLFFWWLSHREDALSFNHFLTRLAPFHALIVFLLNVFMSHVFCKWKAWSDYADKVEKRTMVHFSAIWIVILFWGSWILTVSCNVCDIVCVCKDTWPLGTMNSWRRWNCYNDMCTRFSRFLICSVPEY